MYMYTQQYSLGGVGVAGDLRPFDGQRVERLFPVVNLLQVSGSHTTTETNMNNALYLHVI